MNEKTTRDLRRHLSLAVTYLEDGARMSALAHIVAAHRITKGLPIPKGTKFWKLSVETDQVHK